jgi:hypothetical protein
MLKRSSVLYFPTVRVNLSFRACVTKRPELLALEGELVMEFTAVLESLIDATIGDSLVELRQLQVSEDAVLGETAARPKPVAEQMLPSAQALGGTVSAVAVWETVAFPTTRTAVAGIAAAALSK